MRQTTVFVVDDEEEIGALLTRILSRDGLRVTAFRDATSALAAAEREMPDAVLTDLMMPGVSGLELAARIKERSPRTSVVVMTGFASLENVVDALRSGVDDFVTKPFGAGEIRAVVQRVLARRAASETQTAAPASESTQPAAAAPPAPAEKGERDAVLARRLREGGVFESIHGSIADEADSRHLVGRCGPVLRDVFAAEEAVLLLPAGRAGAFRVWSALAPIASAEREREHEIASMDAVCESGTPAAVAADSLGDLAERMGPGPAAAAPLRSRQGGGPDAGVLVVSRAAGAAPFEGADLRLLGVAATALGDVLSGLRAAERAEDAYVQSLVDVVVATERRAPWFRDHAARVCELSVRLAEKVGLSESEVETLRTAAPLLDLGRVDIGDDVLSKQGRLSSEEWRALRSHPEVADALVRPLPRLREVKPVIRHHHENWDGTGYPDGLRGDDIPYLAALVRITDSFAALTSPRPWREAFPAGEAVRRILEFSGTQFHPQLVAAFAEMQDAPPAR